MRESVVSTLAIELKPSLLLLGLLGIITMISCYVLWRLPVSLPIKCLWFALLICSTVYYMLRDALLQLPWSWKMLEMNSQGELKLTNKSGQQFSPKLISASFIHPLLIILNMKSGRFQWGLPPVIVFNKAANQQHRQLRVRLRWMPELKEIKLAN